MTYKGQDKNPCYHRWSKAGFCICPGCGADQRTVGISALSTIHEGSSGSYDGSINGVPVRRKDRKK